MKRLEQVLLKNMKILFIAGAVGQIHVDRGGRLRVRIVILLVDREREYAWILGEDCGRAVPLMDVRVDDHGRLNRARSLQMADRDGHVVNHAEALAMSRVSMMKTAANIAGPPIRQGASSREDRSAGREPACLDQLGR